MSYRPLRTETGQGEVTGIYLATVTERHWLCSCVWVWDGRYNKHRLKYRSTACSAVSFHSELEAIQPQSGKVK